MDNRIEGEQESNYQNEGITSCRAPGKCHSNWEQKEEIGVKFSNQSRVRARRRRVLCRVVHDHVEADFVRYCILIVQPICRIVLPSPIYRIVYLGMVHSSGRLALHLPRYNPSHLPDLPYFLSN